MMIEVSGQLERIGILRAVHDRCGRGRWEGMEADEYSAMLVREEGT